MEVETRICPFTKERFVPKRSNQLFANSSARIRFNNYLASIKRKEKSPVDKALDKNRKVVLTVLGNNSEATKSKDYLLGAGFDFTVMTHGLDYNGAQLFCIYDVGYYLIEQGLYKLIKL